MEALLALGIILMLASLGCPRSREAERLEQLRELRRELLREKT